MIFDYPHPHVKEIPLPRPLTLLYPGSRTAKLQHLLVTRLSIVCPVSPCSICLHRTILLQIMNSTIRVVNCDIDMLAKRWLLQPYIQVYVRWRYSQSLPAIPSSNPPFTEDEHFIQVGTLERSSSTNCECQFSLVPKEDAHSPSEALKSPTKRRRLMSLVSSREKEQMGNKSEGPPPHPSTSSYSTYPADATFNLHLTSDGFGVDNEGPPYNPHYGKSSPDLSTLSKKKRSLVSLDYGGGLFRKLTKTLVIGGVKEHEVYKYNAVKQWCEVLLYVES